MAELSDKIMDVVTKQPGITDRWLAEAIFGVGTPQQRVNGECRHLATKGVLTRARRSDGLIGNYSKEEGASPSIANPEPAGNPDPSLFSEDEVKRVLEAWLSALGWSVKIAWARTRGIDMHASKDDQRWIIEVKGGGSLSAMRVNYFLGVLGETLQRMDDPDAMYSIAFPDLRQFRNLWSRLPTLAKERTRISALFVQKDGVVEEVK